MDNKGIEIKQRERFLSSLEALDGKEAHQKTLKVRKQLGKNNCCRKCDEVQPLVSVVCMTFNQESYIRDALDGFLTQRTSFPFEIIVHDDASTDATPLIVAEYAAMYSSIIKPIYQVENQYSRGGRALYNHVLPKCQGKYLAFCEGDDYWCEPHKLERQVLYLEEHPECPACAHNTCLLDCRDGSRRFMSKMKKSGMIPISLLLRVGMSYHTSSLVCRKSMFENMPDYAFARSGVGDYPLRVYLALNGGVYYINTPMSVYRYRAKGSWSSRNHADKTGVAKTHDELIEMLHEADLFSGGIYHNYFADAIAEQEFMTLESRGRWREMLVPKYRKFFHECSAKKRARIVVSAVFPSLSRFLSR